MNHNIDKVIETFCKVEKIVSSEKDRLMLGRLIHSLKRIETSLCKYGTMGRQIRSFEKQLCDPWMEDEAVFHVVYESWRQFKESYRREISGMTLNERLCHMGLMEEFEAGLGSRSKMESVLQVVFLSKENIDAIVAENAKESKTNGFR